MSLKSYKFRLYPNAAQRQLIHQTIGCARFVFNQALATQLKQDALWFRVNEMVQLGYFSENRYKGGYFNTFEAIKALPALKAMYPFLKEVDSIALQASLEHLGKGFDRYYQKQGGRPQFKRKGQGAASYMTKCLTTNVKKEGETRALRNIALVQVPETQLLPLKRTKQGKALKQRQGLKETGRHVMRLKLPKLGLVPLALSRHVEGEIKTATVSYTPSGAYYVSLTCDVDIQVLPVTSKKVGIDVGLKHFAVCSDGQVFSNPRWLRKHEARLAFLQRKLSRQTQGSARYVKTKRQIARLHERVFHQRQDYLHKLSTTLIRENQALAIENLNVKNLLQNRQLAKAISEVSWAEFRALLTYKAAWYGRQLTVADAHYASSQLCHACGYKHTAVKNLNLRQWTCPACQKHHDRDLNAAKNLEKLITLPPGLSA